MGSIGIGRGRGRGRGFKWIKIETADFFEYSYLSFLTKF